MHMAGLSFLCLKLRCQSSYGVARGKCWQAACPSNFSKGKSQQNLHLIFKNTLLSQVCISVIAVWANKWKNRAQGWCCQYLFLKCVLPSKCRYCRYSSHSYIMAGQGELVQEQRGINSFLTSTSIEYLAKKHTTFHVHIPFSEGS